MNVREELRPELRPSCDPRDLLSPSGGSTRWWVDGLMEDVWPCVATSGARRDAVLGRRVAATPNDGASG